MIYNGKYVEFDEKASANIQAKINMTNDLPQEFKSDVKPMDVISSEFDTNLEFNNSSYGLFGEDDETNRKVPGMENRDTRYGYYREMDHMEFIHRGIEIIADDSTQSNTDGNTIKITSDDESTKELLETLFLNRLDMNNELWNIIYEMSKFGDNFFEVVPDDYKNPKKIIYLKYLKPEKVTKKMKNGKLLYYEYKADSKNDLDRISNKNLESYIKKNTSKGTGYGIIFKLQPWQIIHFKITDKEFDPYGGSLLKAGVRTFRRLSLLEDVMLVYRISRAPERRVFYIDIGNMNNNDAKRFLQKIKNQYRTQNFIDESGNINKKNNVLSITSDIFVPQRENGGGTKIETLQGGQALQSIDDLKYFKDKILRTMNIPASYLGDDSDRSRGSLASQDIKFARFIERIQAQALKGLNKIAALELFFSGAKKDDLSNFKIELTPPSNIKEITDIDLITQRMNLIGTIQSLNIFSNEWILKNILKMSDKEISDITLQKTLAPQQQQGMEGGMGADMGMGAEPTGDMGAGEMGGEMGGEMPPEGEEQPQEINPETSQELAASTMVKVLGKEFIVENSDDFFKMMKYLKEDTINTKIPIFESLSDIITSEVKIKKPKKTNEIERQFIIGELAGIKWEKGVGKSILLYEKEDSDTIIENEIYQHKILNE